MSEDLVVPLEPDGLIRLRVVPVTTLELDVVGTKLMASAGKATVNFKGKSWGLPDGTPCAVAVTATPDAAGRKPAASSLVTPPKLKVPGYAAGHPDPLDCTLTFELEVVPAQAFNTGKLTFVVMPEFPHAKECPVGGELGYEHKLAFRHDTPPPPPVTPAPAATAQAAGAGRSAKPAVALVERQIGDLVKFTPDGVDVGVFGQTELRVELAEWDDDEGDRIEETEFDTFLQWLPRERHQGTKPWLIGCDAAGHVAYFEPKEKDDWYEFQWRVVAMHGTVAYGVTDWTPVWKAKQPVLVEFDLVEDTTWCDDAKDTSDEAKCARARKKNGGPAIGYTRVYAKGRLTGISAMELHAGVRLWTHRPLTGAPPVGSKAAPRALHVFSPEGEVRDVLLHYEPARPDSLDARTFGSDLLLLDGGSLLESDVARLASASLFGVLEFPAGLKSNKRLPFEDVLEYPATTFLPFGDGDLPRVGKGQTAKGVAITVCTSSLISRPVQLILAPTIAVPVPSIAGGDLVVRSQLIGADLEYWTAAKPVVSALVDGKATEFPAKVDKTSFAQATIPMKDFVGNGKKVQFQMAVSVKDAKLDGGSVAPPDPSPMSPPFDCEPKILDLTAVLAKDGKRLDIKAKLQYFPMNKGLTVELTLKVPVDSKGKPKTPPKVNFKNKASVGLVDDDGDLSCAVYYQADTIASVTLSCKDEPVTGIRLVPVATVVRVET